MIRLGVARAGVAVVSLVLAAACGATADNTSPADSDARIRASTVGVEALGCSLTPAVGTGVVIEQPGIVTTVAHTVAGATEINVVDQNGRTSPAEVVFFDPASDVALLTTELDLGEPLPIGRGDLEASAVVATWDREAGISVSPVQLDRRLRVTIEDIFIEQEVTRTAIEFSGDVRSGDSGAPVIVDGSVIGMVYARARSGDRGFALDDRELTAALRSDATHGELPLSVSRCVP